MSKLEDRVQKLEMRLEEVSVSLDAVARRTERIAQWLGADEADGPFFTEFVELRALLDDLRAKVEGRNKSAAVKRNMTDADAVRVLEGDMCARGHKEAAEELGLTYAQVYSCRMGFTFKHVHRQLEKAGWTCPWAKG